MFKPHQLQVLINRIAGEYFIYPAEMKRAYTTMFCKFFQRNVFSKVFIKIFFRILNGYQVMLQEAPVVFRNW